jgi:hypothetical protein
MFTAVYAPGTGTGSHEWGRDTDITAAVSGAAGRSVGQSSRAPPPGRAGGE